MCFNDYGLRSDAYGNGGVKILPGIRPPQTKINCPTIGAPPTRFPNFQPFILKKDKQGRLKASVVRIAIKTEAPPIRFFYDSSK